MISLRGVVRSVVESSCASNIILHKILVLFIMKYWEVIVFEMFCDIVHSLIIWICSLSWVQRYFVGIISIQKRVAKYCFLRGKNASSETKKHLMMMAKMFCSRCRHFSYQDRYVNVSYVWCNALLDWDHHRSEQSANKAISHLILLGVTWYHDGREKLQIYSPNF